ncbi:MAG TPA: hypothetical protein ENN61_05835 [Bacteroidaceae bacterium]|nr:hypothetical protein [Bacteroidaceae bacterium]
MTLAAVNVWFIAYLLIYASTLTIIAEGLALKKVSYVMATSHVNFFSWNDCRYYPSKYDANAGENDVISNEHEKSPCAEDVRFLPAVEMTKTP